jgi:hypothetical protein
MKFYPNFLYLCVLSITLFSCDTPNTKPKPNDRPSQKEVITYDEVLKLYTCFNRDNLIGNGENNFIWINNGKYIDMKWEKNGENYDLFIKNRSKDYFKNIITGSDGGNSSPQRPHEFIDTDSILNKKFNCFFSTIPIRF